MSVERECRGCGYTQDVAEEENRESWRCSRCNVKNDVQAVDGLEQVYNGGDVSPGAWGG